MRKFPQVVLVFSLVVAGLTVATSDAKADVRGRCENKTCDGPLKCEEAMLQYCKQVGSTCETGFCQLIPDQF
jgi:hypothetical protein